MTTSARGAATRWSMVTARIAVAAAAAVLASACAGDGTPQRTTGAASRTATASLPERTTPAETTAPGETSAPAETATTPAPPRTPVRTDTLTRTAAATTPVSTPTPTEPVLPSPQPTPRPTAPPQTVTATVTATTTAQPTTEEPSSPVSETPTTSPTTPPTEPASDTSGAPAWLWWLLGALALAAIVGVPLVVRARRRRAWEAEYAAAVGEVAWFARVLVPELRQAGSVEQVRGGWGVGEGRTAAVEDQLTALEATAHDDSDRARARGLRDVVRASRERIEGVGAYGAADPSQELERVAVDLEAALATASPAGAPPPPGQAGQQPPGR